MAMEDLTRMRETRERGELFSLKIERKAASKPT
jgi:hypothetical protein